MFYVFRVRQSHGIRAVIYPSRSSGNAHLSLVGQFKTYQDAIACARRFGPRPGCDIAPGVPVRQAGNVSAVMLAVVACIVLAFGAVTPVARDSLSVRVMACPSTVTPAPAPMSQPAVAYDWI